MINAIAASPILVTILALLLGLRSLHAALLGLLFALCAAGSTFPVPVGTAVAGFLRWSPIMAEVLLIVGGGLLLSEILRHAGAQAELARWIKARSGSGLGAVLLIVHGVTPFAESLTGFGIGVTIAIPLLMFIGLPPRNAAVVGLLGLCAVPWGSMGPGTMIAAGMSGLDFNDLGLASAVFSFIPFTVSGIVAAMLVTTPGNRGAAVLLATASAALLTLIVYMANLAFGTPPAGALGGATMIAFHLVLRGRAVAEGDRLNPLGKQGLATYAVLLGGVLATSVLIRAVSAPAGWHYLASPALWLFVASLFFAYLRPNSEPCRRAFRSWLQVAPVTGLFILMGIVMAVTGMASHVALLLSQIGEGYLALTPFVGGMGGFITGSTSGANAMFAATQAEIARSLNVNLLSFMAIHNVAAAYFMMSSPGKVEMAAQIAGPEAQQHRKWIQVTMVLTNLSAGLALAVINLALSRVLW